MALNKNKKGLYILEKSEFDDVKSKLKTTEVFKKHLEYTTSKNSEENVIINQNTKLIIIGSITPSGGKDYYYTSKENKMYEILDNNLSTNLKDNKNNRDELIRILKANHIAFVDIFKEVIRVKDSSRDDHIYFGVLDDIKEYISRAPKDVNIVSNSRLVEEILNDQVIKNEYHTIFSRNTKDLFDKWKKYLTKIGLRKV